MSRPNWLSHVQALGVPGGLGLIMMLVSAWVILMWVPDRHAQTEALSSQVRHLRHDLQSNLTAEGVNQDDAGRQSPERAWQSMWDTLPLDSQRVELLKKLTSSAAKMGISSSSIQYRGALESWSVHAGQALWRQRLTLPVQGRYGDLRSWIGTVLSRPYVSLDALDIQRSDTSSDVVSGRVSLSLWWRVEREGAP